MSVSENKKILVVGGGAAGYFAAISAAKQNPKTRVTIAEAGKHPLQKVLISGGGRCNLTNARFDETRLADFYPRGARELRGPFSVFQARDTIEWFESMGVPLKTEEDGRVFPVSDSSRSIVDCLEQCRKNHGIELLRETRVVEIQKDLSACLQSKKDKTFERYDAILMASGGSKKGYHIAQALGHRIENCVPSLFTFEIQDPRLKDLSGVSVSSARMKLSVAGSKPFKDQGPLLITHWGLSGPAIIRLSAWAARELFSSSYKAELKVSWTDLNQDELRSHLNQHRKDHSKRIVQKLPAIELPKRIWQSLTQAAGIGEKQTYAEITKAQTNATVDQLLNSTFSVDGKGVFKEEFVTCGGVCLNEVEMRTMESKVVPGLHFAGEILDVDGITGGFNFQNAWTTGFIAGKAMAKTS